MIKKKKKKVGSCFVPEDVLCHLKLKEPVQMLAQFQINSWNCSDGEGACSFTEACLMMLGLEVVVSVLFLLQGENSGKL